MILRYSGRYVFQLHKVDELLRVAHNDTMRPIEIHGQGYLWQIGAAPLHGDIWLTIGHEPNQFTNQPDRVIIGVAIDGGMTEFRHIEPAPDVVAAIGPQAAEAVRRLSGDGA